MSLTLPDSLASLVEATPRLIPPSRDLRSAGGQVVQRITPLGQKWVFDCQIKLQTYANALEWAGLLEQAGEVMTMTIPQPRLDIGTPGASVQVDGSGQTGNVLKLKGLPVGYQVKLGQWISVTTGGVVYAYSMRAAATASAGGLMDAPVNPMLHAAHLNNDAVEIAAPKISGFVTVMGSARPIDVNGHVQPVRFMIEERA